MQNLMFESTYNVIDKGLKSLITVCFIMQAYVCIALIH